MEVIGNILPLLSGAGINMGTLVVFEVRRDR